MIDLLIEAAECSSIISSGSCTLSESTSLADSGESSDKTSSSSWQGSICACGDASAEGDMLRVCRKGDGRARSKEGNNVVVEVASVDELYVVNDGIGGWKKNE